MEKMINKIWWLLWMPIVTLALIFFVLTVLIAAGFYTTEKVIDGIGRGLDQ